MYYLEVSIDVVRKTIFLKWNPVSDSDSNCAAQTNEPNPF